MAILATGSIVFHKVLDYKSTTRYYMLRISTAGAPAVPTTDPPPSEWTTTEPEYTSGSTNTLYFVDKTYRSDDSWFYSAVSKSSSYEAAKAAYNKANAAADTANAAKDKIDNLQVGGRNLLLNSSMMKGELRNADSINILNSVTKKEYTDEGYHIITPSTGDLINGVGFIFNDFTKLGFQPGDTISVGFDVKGSSDSNKPFARVIFYASGNHWYGSTAILSPNTIFVPTSDFQRVTYTYTIPADGTYTNKTMMLAFHGNCQSELWIKNIKLEKGSVATDWTEAPEDTDSKISDVDERIVGRNLIKYGKGDSKDGFFSHFPTVNDEYGEFTLKSKRTHAVIAISNGFVIPTREYQPGDCYIWSYDIMFTQWDFTGNSNISEWWMGQRYTNKPAGDTSTATGSWTFVTAHNLPRVGNDYALNEWYHIEQIVKIPQKASDNVGSHAAITFYNSNSESEATITVRLKNVKLEKGTTATDWIPALEESTANVYNEYYQSTSQSSLSGGSWSTAAPKWAQGKYIWSRTVIVDGAGTKTCRPSQDGVCIAGAKGDPGATGNGITDSLILYAPSSDGINPPAEDNGDWTDHIEGLPDGAYLWVRVIYYYSDGTEKSVYSVSKNGETGAKGDKGETGNGIKSTSITYQAHSSQTSVPTGTWLSQDKMPTLSADKPYLWTRVIYTYTDGTSSSPVYTVGSTLDGIQIGGTQLISLIGLDTGRLDSSGALYTSDTKTHKTSAYIPILPGNHYVLSTNATFSSGEYLTLGFFDSSKRFHSRPLNQSAPTSKWSYQFVCPPNVFLARVSFPESRSKNVKLESGNIFSDWSANPNDYYNKEETTALIDVQSDRITSTVKRVSNVETSMSKMEQTVDGVTIELNKKTAPTNMILNTRTFSGWSKSAYGTGASITFEDRSDTPESGVVKCARIKLGTKNSSVCNLYIYNTNAVQLKANQTYTVSMWIKKIASSASTIKPYLDGTTVDALWSNDNDGWVRIDMEGMLATTVLSEEEWTNQVFRFGVSFPANTTGEFLICCPKCESGDTVTAWVESSDYGNNYMRFGTDGLTIGDMTQTELGGNVKIDKDSLDFRIGDDVIATFEYFTGITGYGGMTLRTGLDGLMIRNTDDEVIANLGVPSEGSGDSFFHFGNGTFHPGTSMYVDSGYTMFVGDTTAATAAIQFATSGLIDCPVGVRGNQLLAGTDKTDWNDQKVGVCVSYDGTIHMTHASGANIGYHYAKSAATTSYIKETESGTLELSKNVKVKNALTVGADAKLSFGKQVMWGGVAGIYSSQNQRLYLHASTEANYYLYLGTDSSKWTLAPDTSGKLTLGTANKKWGQIYSTSASINTSDRREKKDINILDPDQMTEFVMALDVVGYKLIDGESGRQHTGMISQQVEEAMRTAGLTDMDFAGFIKSPKYEEIVQEDGTVESVLTDDYIYGLRYEEFIAPMISVIQSQNKKIDALEKRLEELEDYILSKG